MIRRKSGSHGSGMKTPKQDQSVKARKCHYCGGRQDKGLMSFKKKARKLVVGRRCGTRWFPYPTLSRGE